jgi:hypothetical protein
MTATTNTFYMCAVERRRRGSDPAGGHMLNGGGGVWPAWNVGVGAQLRWVRAACYVGAGNGGSCMGRSPMGRPRKKGRAGLGRKKKSTAQPNE